MREKLFNFGQHVIGWFFGILFGATTLFALLNPNLIIGDNWQTGAGTTIVTAFFVIFLLAVCIGLYAFPRFRELCHFIFVDHARLTASILLALVVVWQGVFVSYIHPPIGWDASALHQGLTDVTSPNMRSYFSQNYNNVPVLLVMRWFAHVLGSTSWLTFDLITWGLVDLSAVLNLLALWIIKKDALTPGLYIHALWLCWFPTIIVPYTDAWVLPLVSLMLLGAALLVTNHLPSLLQALGGVLFAFAFVAAYFIKPSAIVPGVGFLMVLALYALHTHKWSWRWLVLAVVTVATFAGSYVGLKHVIENQQEITIDKGREIPPIHFVSMGVSGAGGYNAHDALMMAVLPTKKARSEYSMRKLKERIRKMGPLGYAKFLVQKHANNTADGTFAWDKEGHFINDNPKPKPGPGVANHIKQFVYLYGTNLGDFRWFAQLLWCLCLLLIAFAWGKRSLFIVALRVGIIGSFLYLLAFEGGRSRYLIQTLPNFLLLASLLAPTTINELQRLTKWGNTPEVKKPDNL
ncbi:TIGR03766 family XrtG-associated glycosyltransferase [Lacticaseibacillus zhaodongensis]|uniref:TIGR03766 family XrtG-associated glycosyltransferase n=1 Tax=Lacticaseibacillus zhaodongensis TaxID=2668065 RepID=UPI0012D2F576|nr:TIGR03766 family XrtG-associated glycosyltransferase [Lacticaseibacillus zhaodongensis]